jgi:hypothetical protein
MIISIISNQRRSPYRLKSNDILSVKLNLYRNNKQFNFKNALSELFLNYPDPDAWNKVSEERTTRNGSQILTCSCRYIENITNCLGYVKTTINNHIYHSNIIRFNFISDYTIDESSSIYTFENLIIVYENNIFTF